MQYWDDMNTKYGFSDGGAVPYGAEYFRDVYIKVVNELAARRNSAVRVVPYDRPGCHNWCLVWFVTKEWFEKEYESKQPVVGQWMSPTATALFDPTVRGDEAMAAAVNAAMMMNLDNFVMVMAETKTAALGDFLVNIDMYDLEPAADES